MSDGMNRRRFLKVLGVTGGGAAVMGGCSTEKAQQIIPYLVPVDDQIPGLATYYASTCRECSAGCGLHVKVREGRAIKLEGNPENPINQGKLCARAQASLQGTYNPDRVRSPMARNAAGGFDELTWDDAIKRVADKLSAARADRVWFVTGEERGSFDALVKEWLRALGSANRVVYEPFGYEAIRAANRQVFGTSTMPTYDFAQAEYVLSFGADFLGTWVSPVEYARGFTAAHHYRDKKMGRYVHIEPRMSLSAISADEWLKPIPGSEGLVALAMARVIMDEHLGHTPADARILRAVLEPHAPEAVAARTDLSADTIKRLAREFTAHPSIALPGGIGAQHPDGHLTAAAVNVLNYVAGNVGRTVVFGADLSAGGGGTYANLQRLVQAANNGQVDVLFVHGANPAYAAPTTLEAGAAVAKAGFKVSFSRFFDETAMLADLILPDHDPIEQWNDYEPRAGVHLLLQPAMEPVFQTRQTGDVLIAVAAKAPGAFRGRFAPARTDGYTYKTWVQDRWKATQRSRGDHRPFDTFWREALQHGGVWGKAPTQHVRLASTATKIEAPSWTPSGPFTLIAYPSPALFDGRSANRPWLQELPDPVTKMTWGTWLEIHPDTAGPLGIAPGDILEVTSAAGTVQAQAYLYPGVRKDVVAMPIGQGHTAYGRYAKDRGANAYTLLPKEPTASGGVAHYTPVTIRNTGGHVRLATTEGSRRELGRGIAQGMTLAAIQRSGPEIEREQTAAPIPERVEKAQEDMAKAQYEGTQLGVYALEATRWGMAIDLSRCTGCSACVTACSNENNIPYVGEESIRRGRDMMWMRIERYFEGGGDEPLEARVIPMLCQQCGNATCEPVCPVFAAYHTPDGLNGQVYNRCVGTRYCSNNCPYKVRYFNWFDWGHPGDPDFAWPEPMNWLLNPDVTVRSKGVMEKCTFCIQRIRRAQHESKLRGTPIEDGEIVTACQQTCPTDAIVFGNRTDQEAQVTKLGADARGYHVLEGLNTHPSITYLLKIRNVVEA